MKKASCIIVDDEHPARVLLKEYVSKVPQLELVGVFKNPVEAMSFIRDHTVDIFLLDIQMPELTGIEFIKSLTQKPKVIFTTAYSNYALEGYELDVVDYLLKPIRFERFLHAINKALDLLSLEQNQSPGTVEEKILNLKADHKIHRVKISDINYIEGFKEYVRFHLPEEKIITLESLKKLEDELSDDQFLRIHKSYIINTRKVKSIYGNQVEIGDQYLPIGKSYREKVFDRLTN